MPPMSLPEDLVDAARRDRERQALDPITSQIDRMVREGMGGLEAVAKGAAEQVAPVMQLLQGGELKLPTLDDLTPEWMRPKPVQAATMAPAQTPATMVDGRQQPQPRMQPGEQMGNVTITQGAGDGFGVLDESSPEAFRQSLADSAQVVADKYDLPVSIIAAIPIQETGFRVSRLGREGNNLFSIKGEGPAGSMQFSEGAAPEDLNTPFRKYNNAAESFDDFGRLITTQPRYAKAVQVWRETRDPAAFIRAVQEAGYATDWGDADGTGIPWWQKVVNISRDIPQPRPVQQRPQATTPPQAEQTPMAQQQGQYAAGSWTPNQINAATAEGLDYETALAVCGPAAAIAFARKNGRNPSMQEAVALAREVGWTPDAGMAGPASQQKLLERMGVAARLEDGAPNWQAVAADVQRGNPVTISTPGHYFVAERYDPESGAFDFGQSAAVLKASGGRTWFRPEELANLGMGEARATLYIDNPNSPSPSVAAGRMSLNTAPTASPPGGADNPAGAGAASPPAPATTPPAAPWASETAQGGLMMKSDGSDEPMMGPGDGGYAPTPYEQPFDPDQGPREAAPGSVGSQPLPQTPNPMTYGPIQQGDVAEGPPTLGDVSYQNGGEPTGNGPWTEMPVRPLEAQQPAQDEQASAAPSGSMTDHLGNVLLPVLDAAGNVVSYVQQQARNIGRQIAPRGNPVANVAQGLTPGGQTYGQAVAPIMNPRRETNVAPEAFVRDAMDIGTNAPKIPGAVDQKITDIANEARQQFQQAGQAYGEGDMTSALYNGVLGALNVVASPWTVAAEGIDTALPTMRDNSVLSMGDAITNADMIRDARHIANGVAKLIAAGRRVTPEIVAALRNGTAVEDILNSAASAIDRGIERAAPIVQRAGEVAQGVGREVAGAWDANAARVAAADARMAEQGGSSAFGMMGVSPGQNRRFYHGTASEFGMPDPGKFDPEGLFGPGYYLTSDPRVASSYATERGTPYRVTSEQVREHLQSIADATRRTGADGAENLADAYERAARNVPPGRDFLQGEVERMTADASFSAGDVDFADARLWGPAREARGALFEMQGPNVRAVDVPKGLRLLDIDGRVKQRDIRSVAKAIKDPYIRQDFLDSGLDAESLGDDLYGVVKSLHGSDKTEAIRVLQAAGYDGITHQGGKLVPLIDDAGRPIEHDVTIIFPESLTKIRNAFSGEVGGATLGATPGPRNAGAGTRIATDIGNSLAGGMAGAVYSEATGDQENLPRNVLAGMVGAPILGRGMRRAGGALGTPGVGPNGGRPVRRTVEVVQERIDVAARRLEAARAAGDDEAASIILDHIRTLESELVDAKNARLDLEPRIASDVGRRIEDLPLDARSADDFAGLGREWVSPDAASDLTQPSAVATDMRGRQNGLIPGFDPGSALAGGAAGAMSEGEDGEQGDPLRTAAGILLAGVGGGMSPGARARLQRAMQQAERLKAAGRLDEAAQVVQRALDATPGYEPRLSREPVLPGFEPPRRVPGDAGPPVSDAPNLPGNRMGNVPPSQLREPTLPGMEGPYTRPNIPDVSETPNRGPVLGDVPPSAVNQGALPGMDPLRDVNARPLEEVVADVQIPESLNTPNLQRALTSAERRAENMQRRGLTTPSVWDWIKQAGYAGVYGPATFSNAVIGGAQELVGGQAKELARALVSGRPGSYADQVGAQVRAVPDSLAGLGRVLFGAGSEGAAAVSGGSQGTANLSERVVNPVGHFVARMLERPGELLTEAPDAVFRPLFMAQGMAREARAVAAEAGMRGRRAAEYADELLQAAEELRANPDAALASDEARRIVEAGTKHADELGYKGPSSSFGRKLGEWSKRDDAIGVIASFLVPFPAMAERMSRAAARSTPGVGLLPGIRRGQASKFDVVYDQAFGTAVAAGLTYWAFNGGITGSGPADPEKRQMMIDQGWQPNSVLVGGYYVPNRVLGRFQPMLDTAGEIHDALAYGKADAKPGELAADLVKRGAKIATNQIGLSGLADLNDMLTQGFASRFPGWVARSGIRYLPYGGVMRAGAAATDSSPRKPEGWGDVGLPEAITQQAMTAVPGMRQRLPATQTSLGQDAPNPQQGFGAIIPRVTTQRDDPVIRLFQDAGVDIPKPSDSFSIRNMVPESQRPPGSPSSFAVALTPAEQRTWNTVRGQELTRQAGILQARAGWSAKPVAQRQADLKLAMQAASEKANAEMQKQLGAREVNERIRTGLRKKAS